MSLWTQLQHMEWSEQKALQNRLLHEYITRRLYPFSPYYRALFDREGIKPENIRRVEDLAEIPFTTKQDLMPSEEDPDRAKQFVLSPTKEAIREHWPLSAKLPLLFKSLLGGKDKVAKALRKEYYPVFMTFTTGRSAMPVPFLYSSHDLDQLCESGSRLTEVLGIEQDWRIVNLFPYAPHLAFWQVAAAGFERGILTLSTGGGKVAGTEGNLRALQRMKPQCIIGVPGYLYHLLREAHKRRQATENVKLVVLGADTVPPGLKTKLRELLRDLGSPDVQILGTYGFTEARMAFAECPTEDGSSSGYHFYPDKGVVEIVDPATGLLRDLDSDGEIVYTPICGRGTSLLRYRTGDLVEGGIKTGPCPHCGRTLPRLGSKLSRASSVTNLQLMKVKGTLVNMEEIGLVLANDEAVEEWQIEVRKKDDDPLEVDQLILFVSLKQGSVEALVKKRIKSNVMASTEVTPNEIRVLPTEKILSKVGMEKEMKEKRFVDMRVKS